MSLVDRHHEDERAGVISSHGFNDTISHKGMYKPANIWFDGPRFIIKDLFVKCDTPHILLTVAFIYLTSIIGVMTFEEMGLISFPRAPRDESFYGLYVGGYLKNYCCATLILLGIKYLARPRFLVFEDGWVYLHTKTKGVWGYPVSQLKFHIIKGTYQSDPYFLEMELPEPLFNDDEKMVILEVAAQKGALDGTLAVLLPLLKGDMSPYEIAENRHYIGIPNGEPASAFYKFRNFENHIFTWFLVYRYNQFIFWLVHGTQKKLARRLREYQQSNSA